MPGLPEVGLPPACLPGIHGPRLSRRRLLAGLLVGFAALYFLRSCGADLPVVGRLDPAAAVADGENLADGYKGPPVVMAVAEPRTEAHAGACVVIAADRSASMASAADPDGQMLKEIRAAFEALALDANPGDLSGAVIFADSAAAEGPLVPSDPKLAIVTSDDAGLGGGTSFVPAVGSMATILHRCGPERTPVPIIVSDGAYGDEEARVRAQLDRLPSSEPLHLVALDHEGVFRGNVARWWRRQPNVDVIELDELHAGSVADAIADILSQALGTPVLAGFRTT